VNPVTMAGVYATFAARGEYCQPHPVADIRDRRGDRVDIGTPRCTRVMPKAVADAVNDILQGVIAPGGFASGSALSQPAAGKTGTTNDNFSVWFDGYTPNLATAAMIAGVNSSNQPAPITDKYIGGDYITFSAASGSGLAAPMWAQAMRAVQKWLPDQVFVEPDKSKLGYAGIDVPALGGLSVSDASAQLKSLGLDPVVGSTVDSSYPEGTVAYTSPGSGDQAINGQTVTLSISDGSPYVPPAPTPNGGGNGNPGGGGDNPGGDDDGGDDGGDNPGGDNPGGDDPGGGDGGDDPGGGTPGGGTPGAGTPGAGTPGGGNPGGGPGGGP
jgi:membrane peptidoglycan carboxypeptidase